MSEQETSRNEGAEQAINKSFAPIVFMFQPTHFEVVPADRLHEWERDLVERVGLRPEIISSNTGTGTWCGCPTFDDSDQD